MFKKGFTLVELMVVIAIIGILASIITVSLVSSKAKGRDAKRIADVRTIQLALEEYYNDNGSYPVTLASLANYLPNLPSDPNATALNVCTLGNEAGCYVYNSFTLSSSGITNCGISPHAVKYHLGAAMETNETNNATLFLQDNDWDPTSSYTLCSGGGGRVASFVGKSTSNCSATTGTPDSCYDVTN